MVLKFELLGQLENVDTTGQLSVDWKQETAGAVCVKVICLAVLVSEAVIGTLQHGAEEERAGEVTVMTRG